MPRIVAKFTDLAFGYYVISPAERFHRWYPRGTDAILANVVTDTQKSLNLKSEYPTIEQDRR